MIYKHIRKSKGIFICKNFMKNMHTYIIMSLFSGQNIYNREEIECVLYVMCNWVTHMNFWETEIVTKHIN